MTSSKPPASKPPVSAGQPAFSGPGTMSELARRRSRMLAWGVLGLTLFACNLWLAHQAAQRGYVTYVFTQTILWSVLPYLLACLMIDRTIHVPSIEGNSLIGLSTAVPFAALLGVVLMFHLPYSRGALLLSYGVTLLWLWLGYRRFISRYVPVFGALDAQAVGTLQAMLDMPGAARPAPATLRVVHSETEARQCDGIMLDRGASLNDEQARLLVQLKISHVRIYSVERVGELLTGRVGLAHIDTEFHDEHVSRLLFDAFKRLTDIAGALVLLPFALPASLLVALAIRTESSGPVLFRQARMGRFGRPFTLLKFRSMTHQHGTEHQFAVRDDPRVTRVGRIIRKYRLDELPQLWNVLAGEMSLIGPRPEIVEIAQRYAQSIPYYPYRHLVRPGLSGWAQVQQGYTATDAESVTKLGYDLYYVKHRSLALDLLIAAKTLRTLLTGYGAR